ncbi:MAG: hypothetical protein R3B84_15920 [Zavarzinella sp.]
MAISGRWQGYWIQSCHGKRSMTVTLKFEQGIIEGDGIDCIGPFLFLGQYDSIGNVAMVKKYLGRHHVEYFGTYDGEGTIFGQWLIESLDSGTFAMKLESVDPDSSFHVIEAYAPVK